MIFKFEFNFKQYTLKPESGLNNNLNGAWIISHRFDETQLIDKLRFDQG